MDCFVQTLCKKMRKDRPLNRLEEGVFSALFSWRDQLARREDESTGYILPNATLLR